MRPSPVAAAVSSPPRVSSNTDVTSAPDSKLGVVGNTVDTSSTVTVSSDGRATAGSTAIADAISVAPATSATAAAVVIVRATEATGMGGLDADAGGSDPRVRRNSVPPRSTVALVASAAATTTSRNSPNSHTNALSSFGAGPNRGAGTRSRGATDCDRDAGRGPRSLMLSPSPSPAAPARSGATAAAALLLSAASCDSEDETDCEQAAGVCEHVAEVSSPQAEAGMQIGSDIAKALQQQQQQLHL